MEIEKGKKRKMEEKETNIKDREQLRDYIKILYQTKQNKERTFRIDSELKTNPV